MTNVSTPPSTAEERRPDGPAAPTGEPGFRAWLSSTSAWSGLLLKTASVAGLLIVWQLGSVWLGELVVPTPLAVVDRLVEVFTEEQFFFHMGQTLFRVLAGMGLSLVLAVLVGIPMGLSRGAERFFDVYVLLGLTIPGLAWALIAVMVVGITNWAPVLAIVATTTPMVTLNIWEGTKNLDRDLAEMARSFRAERSLVLRDVILPQLLPFVLAGARLGFALAWKIVVLSEMFGLSNGVGYQLNVNFSQFSISGVIAWTLSFTAVMGLLEFGVMRPVEQRLMRWRPPAKR